MTDAENPENPTPHLPDALASGPVGEPLAGLRPEDWPDSDQLAWADISAQEMEEYGITVRRVEWMIVAAGLVSAVAVIWPLGWAISVGILLGTVLGWVNFRWLASSVNAIGSRIVKAKSQERGAAIVARGVGRILLIAVFAYVIFTCSVRGLVGFLAGLAMPVVAMMCEAAYEFVASYRRSS